MSFWVEIHCDVPVYQRAPGDAFLATGCLSNRNASVGEMFGELKGAASFLARRAQKQGWKRTRSGWVCPACQKIGAKAE